MSGLTCLAELHSHSSVSDGRPLPEELVIRAAQMGLAAIAVSDHNTFRGSAIALKAARDMEIDVQVIPANEVRTSRGDVLVICPSVPDEDPAIGIDPLELRDWARDMGCVTIAAHPFQPGRKGVGRYLLRSPDAFDAIEAWNARGMPFLNMYAEHVARRLSKPITSGSDAHVIEELGTLPTRILTGDCNAEGVVEAVQKGACVPSRGIMRPSAAVRALYWSVSRRLK